MNLLFCVLLAVLGLCSASYYASDSGVIELRDNNFKQNVLQSDEIWVVEFYQRWSVSCLSFRDEYSKAAKSLKGIAKVAAIDGKGYPYTAKRYGVNSFPTIKIFADKKNPKDYTGDLSAFDLTNEVKKISARRQGVNTNSTITPYGSSNSTKTPYGSSNSTISPYGSSNSTISPYGSSNSTISPYGSSNSTISPYGSSNSTKKHYGPSNSSNNFAIKLENPSKGKNIHLVQL